MPKWSILASFWKPEACGQTELTDRSVLIGQKLVENAKIQMRHFEVFLNNVRRARVKEYDIRYVIPNWNSILFELKKKKIPENTIQELIPSEINPFGN